MGKAQSKRSVDITTVIKGGSQDGVIDTMDRISVIDKTEVNEDATACYERSAKDEVKCEKDLTTEKNDLKFIGDSSVTPKDESELAGHEKPFLADDCSKKCKKERVKKKWSFRNISFGKKDKQKSVRTDETAEDFVTPLNGLDNDEKVAEHESFPKEDSSENAVENNARNNHQNTKCTREILDGEEQIEGSSSTEHLIDTDGDATNSNTSEISPPFHNGNAIILSQIHDKTENTAITKSVVNEIKFSERIIATDDELKNEISEEIVREQDSGEIDDNLVNPPDAKNNIEDSTISTIHEVGNMHQNADNAISKHEERSKDQFEEMPAVKDFKDIIVMPEVTRDITTSSE